MIPTHQPRLALMLREFFRPRPKETVADWCCRCLVFDEPMNSGPFNLAGSEYMREQLDAWADPTIRRQVQVQGTQTRKTGTIMGGAAWRIANNPTRLFWVMPTQEDVEGFSKTRWLPMLKATPHFIPLIPTGAERHDFKTRQQMIGGSIVDFKWSNSPSALSSTPAPDVILDEVDKFPATAAGGKEADAVTLAEQRTKSFPDYKIVATSTPTLVTGLIWQRLLESDLRRRFLECPLCPNSRPRESKMIVLGWSKDFSVLPLLGNEAWVRWDKEAKKPDGTWDFDRVERSARFECPHCGGHIRDAHKTIMDRHGEWRPTRSAPRGIRGWHLPSLYAASEQRNVGILAMEFLKQKRSLLGLQGFVNNELAEPWVGQADLKSNIYEITSPTAPEMAEAVNQMTIDCQLLAPFFWWVVRRWDKQGNSRLIAYGSANSEEELAELQKQHDVPDHEVGMDYKFKPQEVIERCLKHGVHVPFGQGKRVWRGWKPMRGVPRNAIFKTTDGKPSFTSMKECLPHSQMRLFNLPLLQFNGPVCKDILDRLRKKKTTVRWEICPGVGEDYFKHMGAEYFDATKIKEEGGGWQHRNRVPNHLWDCEVQQIARALSSGRLKIGDEPAKAAAKPAPTEETSHAE